MTRGNLVEDARLSLLLSTLYCVAFSQQYVNDARNIALNCRMKGAVTKAADKILEKFMLCYGNNTFLEQYSYLHHALVVAIAQLVQLIRGRMPLKIHMFILTNSRVLLSRRLFNDWNFVGRYSKNRSQKFIFIAQQHFRTLTYLVI